MVEIKPNLVTLERTLFSTKKVAIEKKDHLCGNLFGKVFCSFWALEGL
jgi:hypothetical protein